MASPLRRPATPPVANATAVPTSTALAAAAPHPPPQATRAQLKEYEAAIISADPTNALYARFEQLSIERANSVVLTWIADGRPQGQHFQFKPDS